MNDSCWIWLGARNRDGYGTVGGGAKKCLAHRAAYEAVHGAIGDGLTLDHLCNIRECINPVHLEPVARAVNTRRGGNTVKTACKWGHPFDEKNTLFCKGVRYCRTCMRRRDAQRRARKAT